MLNLIHRYDLEVVKFDGCALGLKSIVRSTLHAPIRKPWRIATNCPEIIRGFGNKICNKGHAHVPCDGENTKVSECYTPMYVKCLHDSFEQAIANRR